MELYFPCTLLLHGPTRKRCDNRTFTSIIRLLGNTFCVVQMDLPWQTILLPLEYRGGARCLSDPLQYRETPY
jgi:hypothetical protein